VFLISPTPIHHHHPTLLRRHALTLELDRLLAFPLAFPTLVLKRDAFVNVSFQRYRLLKLPLSCKVVQKVVFGPQFVGDGIPQILDKHFQIAVTSGHVTNFVEFRSATSEIDGEKRKKKESVVKRP